MSIQLKQILQQASSLSHQEQLILIASLSQALAQESPVNTSEETSPSLSAEEETELLRRLDQVKKGETQPIPWKEALAEIKKRQGL